MIGSMGSERQLDQKTKEQLQNKDLTALANESMEHLDPGDVERKNFSACDFMVRAETQEKEEAAKAKAEGKAKLESKVRMLAEIEAEAANPKLKYVNMRNGRKARNPGTALAVQACGRNPPVLVQLSCPL